MSRVSRLVDFVRKNTTFVDWGVILLLAFLPFWNVGWGVWEAYDQGFPLIPANELFRSLFAWNDLAGAGGPNGIVTSVFLPFKLLTTMLASSGLGLGLVQRFIDVVMFAASGWGMYYLETVIFHFGDSGAKRVAGVLAAVL